MRAPGTHMGRLLEAAYEFYADPANVAAFEEWKAKGKPPVSRRGKRTGGSESAPRGVLERSIAQ